MVQLRGVTKFKIKISKTTHRFSVPELAFCMERRKVDRENRTPLTNSLNEGIFSHQSHQNGDGDDANQNNDSRVQGTREGVRKRAEYIEKSRTCLNE